MDDIEKEADNLLADHFKNYNAGTYDKCRDLIILGLKTESLLVDKDKEIAMLRDKGEGLCSYTGAKLIEMHDLKKEIEQLKDLASEYGAESDREHYVNASLRNGIKALRDEMSGLHKNDMVKAVPMRDKLTALLEGF